MIDNTPLMPAALIQGHFEIELVGLGSRVKVNGMELPVVQDVKVHQPLDGPLIVTVVMVADSVKGIRD